MTPSTVPSSVCVVGPVSTAKTKIGAITIIARLAATTPAIPRHECGCGATTEGTFFAFVRRGISDDRISYLRLRHVNHRNRSHVKREIFFALYAT
jgi:hypothetical protein